MASSSAEFSTSAPAEAIGERIWRLAGAAILGGLILWLYGRVLISLSNDWWNDPGASYGFLVPPIAGYFAYLRRAKTLAWPATMDLRGLWVTLGAGLLYLGGRLGAEFFITRLSLIILLAGMAWTFWGLPRTRTLAFPLLLLVTAIPLPALIYNRIAVPLQLFASDVSTALIRLCGESVYQDGNVLQLANTTLGVAEACSGLHSLASMVVASIVLGFAEFRSIWARLALVALSIPLAIGVNVFRVTGTALLANYDEQYAQGFYHSFAGWLVFVAGFGLLWLAAILIRKLTRHQKGVPA